MWTLEKAVELCRAVEELAPRFGCHVALTGGTLYKDGPRKDCDILFYRIRQCNEIPRDALFVALETIGIKVERGFGWCYKAHYGPERLPVDMFFPESDGMDYPQDEPSLDVDRMREDVREVMDEVL